jgi:hypothetical protein
MARPEHRVFRLGPEGIKNSDEPLLSSPFPANIPLSISLPTPIGHIGTCTQSTSLKVETMSLGDHTKIFLHPLHFQRKRPGKGIAAFLMRKVFEEIKFP